MSFGVGVGVGTDVLRWLPLRWLPLREDLAADLGRNELEIDVVARVVPPPPPHLANSIDRLASLQRRLFLLDPLVVHAFYRLTRL